MFMFIRPVLGLLIAFETWRWSMYMPEGGQKRFAFLPE